MPRILVVDDDSQVREMLAEMLRRVGHDLATAATGRDGLEALRDGPFDIVILDMIMPDMNGVDTIRLIRSEHPTVAVVALSGGGSFKRFDLLEQAEELGVEAVLTKPVDWEEITTAVESAMGRQNGTADNRAG